MSSVPDAVAPSSPPHLVAALRVDGRACLVVGGGPVAARRARRLAEAGAVVTVVAPRAVDEIRSLPVTWEPRRYERGDTQGRWLVVAATGDPGVDDQVLDDAEAAGALVCAVSDPARSTIGFPASAREGGLSVHVWTDGRSPALAGWLCRQLARELADGYGAVTELMAASRAALVEAGRPTTHPGWDAALDAGLVDLVRGGRVREARSLLARSLELDYGEAAGEGASQELER